MEDELLKNRQIPVDSAPSIEVEQRLSALPIEGFAYESSKLSQIRQKA